MPLFNRKKNNETRQFFPYLSTVFSSGVFSAERNLAVDNVVSLIANTVSILPLKLYQYTKNGKQELWSHDISVLLKDPAVEESAELFYRTMIRHMLLSGNAYIYKHKSGGKILSLELIDPVRVTIRRDNTGRKLFNITGERGGVYTDKDIIHIPYIGEGYSGTKGSAPCEVHKEDVHRNDLIAEYISVFFQNGIGSRLLVELGEKYEPGSPKIEKLMQEFKQYFNAFVLGPNNAGQPIITVPGTKISKIEQTSNVQGDVLNLYKESCAEIYRMYDVPPEIVDSKESKYGSLEQKQQDFYLHCIAPLCKHIAEVLAKNLLDDYEMRYMFITFDYSGMLEVDIHKKLEYYKLAFHSGIMTLGEIRDRLDLSPVEDEVARNTYMIPSNLMPFNETTIDSFMAKSRLALEKIKNPDDDLNNKDDHLGAGDNLV